ncbi:MAG: hypothetical protein ABSH40_13865 [Bryobacteraceae bacterium]|jgi:hypothetical protein
MTCVEFWNHLREGGLEASAGSGHLAECAACAARWNRQQALEAGLRLVSAGMRGEEAPPRVEAGLVAAFRAQAGFKRRQASRQSWRSYSWWPPVLTWASAAATVVLAMVLMHGSRPVPAPIAPMSAPNRIAPAAVESADVAADRVDEDSYGADSDFIPVPNAARIEPNEDVHLVRVEATRSAMMALGIVVGAENASDTVVADVVLGSDGMARAVRLVTNGDGSLLEEE